MVTLSAFAVLRLTVRECRSPADYECRKPSEADGHVSGLDQIATVAAYSKIGVWTLLMNISDPSSNDPIGAQQDRIGKFDTERVRRSHVYYQLEREWLFDGQICRLCAPENLVYVGGRTAKLIRNVWSIGDEAADIDKIARFVNRRKSLFSGKRDYARSLIDGEGIGE